MRRHVWVAFFEGHDQSNECVPTCQNQAAECGSGVTSILSGKHQHGGSTWVYLLRGGRFPKFKAERAQWGLIKGLEKLAHGSDLCLFLCVGPNELWALMIALGVCGSLFRHRP